MFRSLFRTRTLSKTTRTLPVPRTMIFPTIFSVPVPVLHFQNNFRTPYHFRTQKYTLTRIPYSLRTRTWVRSTVRVRNPYPYSGVCRGPISFLRDIGPR